MCASNKDALDYVSQRAAQLASILRSDTGRYYFWVNDAKDAHCHCGKCCRLSPSDQALLLCNAILKGIRSVDANAKQSYLAYLDTMETPRVVQPEEGIFLEFAPVYRDTKIPLNENSCSKNRQYISRIAHLLAYFGKRMRRFWNTGWTILYFPSIKNHLRRSKSTQIQFARIFGSTGNVGLRELPALGVICRMIT